MYTRPVHDCADEAPCAHVARTATRRRISAGRCALIAAALCLLSACGGGGGALPPVPEPPTFVDGLSGAVMLPDFDLGRIVEQEPNDSRSQPFDIAPFWPGSSLEVAGDLGTSKERFGRADPADVLRLSSMVDQRIDLELTFEALDPLGDDANELTAQVVDAVTGAEIVASQTGPQPLELGFDAVAGTSYDLILRITAGHAWYVLRVVGSQAVLPPLPPAPPPEAKPGLQASPVAAAPASAACAGTHLLVRFEDDCDPATFCAENAMTLGRRTASGSYLVHFGCDAADDGQQKARALGRNLAARPGVRWAEPDWVVTAQGEPGDPLYNRQWNMRMVGAPSAWDITTGSPDVIVGVLDTGIVDHPDLEGQVVGGYDFISEAARAGDGDGRDPDPTDMGDQADGSGLSIWHGTHVAGIVAAKRDNGQGGAGIASGVKLLILRVIGVGGGLVSDAVDAILYAAALHTTSDGRKLEAPIDILNLSVGLPQDSPDLRVACERAANNGVLLVASVGNTGSAVLYPAAYPSTVAVAAVDGKQATTQYSNFGNAVDIAAPGGSPHGDQWNDGWFDGVLSTVMDETVEPAASSHAYIVGTSQAAPHVAGAAALLKSIDPSLNAIELKNLLTSTALDLGVPGEDVAFGSGLLQVHEAVKRTLLAMNAPRSDDPYLQLTTRSLQFDDFIEQTAFFSLPLHNGGDGTLNLFHLLTFTDDGANWLGASYVPANGPGVPVNNKEVQIFVDRNQVPDAPGRYSGHVLLGNSSGILGSIRVVMYVDEQTRAGRSLPVYARDDRDIARRRALATADRGYRFWFRGLPPTDYTLQAGEDLDGDGFICDAFEACGWFGGPLEDDAVPVPFVSEGPAQKGLGILIAPQLK